MTSKADFKLVGQDDPCHTVVREGMMRPTLNRKTDLWCAVLILVSLSACSRAKDELTGGTPFPAVQSFPIEASQLKNCRFQTANPVYSQGQRITDNRISCDQGVPRSVQILGPTALPSGLQFSMDKIALVGTPGEKITSANYSFYLENEAGYVILKMALTVK
jgi:hypothetical protein